jgi:chloramphenicol 3-O phosphotransferase
VRRWQEEVHRPGIYDLEVDTSILTPEQCAAAIRNRLMSGRPGDAFTRVARLGQT